MENISLTTDDWNQVTTTLYDHLTSHLSNVGDFVLKVIYIIIGTVGVLDNLFVIFVFILYIKITDKVGILQIYIYRSPVPIYKTLNRTFRS